MPTNDVILDALRELLYKSKVQTQEDIKQSLATLGFELTQSKISRLLRKIGAVKTSTANGQSCYRLPLEPAPPSTKTPLTQLIIDINHNETLIVVRTSPGSASLIARLLDHHWEAAKIIGTVAGDDTILIIPQAVTTINITLAKVKKLLSNVSL